MSVKTLPQDARPREKLLSRGELALSDAELLAIVLRTGFAGMGVLQLAQQLLDTMGGLRGLLNAHEAHLATVKGLGPAKRAEVLAVLALAKRAMAQELRERSVFDSPQTVLNFAQLQLGSRQHEVFAVMFLDVAQRLIACEELFRGTLTQTAVYPREIAVRALANNACALVLMHNHPSGELTPSAADYALTRNVASALGLLDVRVLDHVIVGPSRAVSMSQDFPW